VDTLGVIDDAACAGIRPRFLPKAEQFKIS